MRSSGRRNVLLYLCGWYGSLKSFGIYIIIIYFTAKQIIVKFLIFFPHVIHSCPSTSVQFSTLGYPPSFQQTRFTSLSSPLPFPYLKLGVQPHLVLHLSLVSSPTSPGMKLGECAILGLYPCTTDSGGSLLHDPAFLTILSSAHWADAIHSAHPISSQSISALTRNCPPFLAWSRFSQFLPTSLTSSRLPSPIRFNFIVGLG